MKILNEGVTAPKGFSAADTAAGIKYQGRTDMAMVYSEADCNVAGTYTTNVVKAAPVIWDRDVVVKGGSARAIVVNSGIANACTGKEGMDICKVTADAAAEALDIKPEQVLIGSTGVIGMQIKAERITAGTKDLATKLEKSFEASERAAKAIMTTDTKHKMIAAEIELSGVKATIGAMTKGSGMIHPNMCTMLCYITTDAAISNEMLQKALSASIVDSYNMISVDGDTSTNDTCLILANGLAGNKLIDSENDDYKTFCEALDYINKELAKQMAADGEGASHLYEVIVNGAKTKDEAVTLSKSVVSSSLCKAAIYGKDANCGRFMCALGYAGVDFDPDMVDIYFESDAGSVLVVSKGAAPAFDEEIALKVLSADAVTVRCEMNAGNASATAWGCDLTYDYVKINADYRS
ncbi:MAG: bifunctional glutamate N-acetyltransferase/amino-acid acetyltransferase ArgJ [Lachnospiraceae bacterium]|nr:bifunctional glutamate N-acetyltransferase/amino-acid acetyltransferase ArgJ [Lachnospiraceae bacterium]